MEYVVLRVGSNGFYALSGLAKGVTFGLMCILGVLNRPSGTDLLSFDTGTDLLSFDTGTDLLSFDTVSKRFLVQYRKSRHGFETAGLLDYLTDCFQVQYHGSRYGY